MGCFKFSRLKSKRGSSVLVLMVMIATLSMTIFAFFTSSNSFSSENSRFFAEKNALYAADGVREIAAQIAQEYLRDNPGVTPEAFQDHLRERLPALVPPGTDVEEINASILAQSGSQPVTTGPFKGMSAPQTQVEIGFKVSTGHGGNRFVRKISARMTLAQLGLHQFMYFIDLDQSGYNPLATALVNGRFHANGDLCLSGGTDTTFTDSITAAGRIMHGRRTDANSCGIYGDAQSAYDKAYILTASGKVPFMGGTSATARGDNGCTSCRGTTMSWRDYALSTYKGQVLDVAHGVTKLSLPLPPRQQVQLGAETPDPYAARSNAKNLRFLIDPVINGEDPETMKYKFSYQADIRIIAGIWYLKNVAQPDQWPGIPIWSDHPGHFQDPHGNWVGQADLLAAGRWTETTIPKRFSFYEYDPVNKSVFSNTDGVISYGTLVRQVSAGGVATWKPGHLITNHVSISSWEKNANKRSLCLPAYNDDTIELLEPNGIYPIDRILTCSNGKTPSIATHIINATRSGFMDYHLEASWRGRGAAGYNYPGAPSDYYRNYILPMNFDMAQFQEALKDTTPGELGSYFGPGKLIGHKFNGIVFTSLSWQGSNNGFFPNGIPNRWPTGLTLANPAPVQIYMSAAAHEMNFSLPMELCASATSSTGPQPGWKFDHGHGVGGDPRFKIMDCATDGSDKAHAMSVRFFNARTVDTNLLDRGFSFVSNMPVYVQGDVNVNSDTSSMTSTPWKPFLIAADQLTFLSNAWNDSNARWNSAQPNSRVATDTTYNLSIITGWAVTGNYYHHARSMGINSIPTLMEDWTSKDLTFNGSVVVGFYPVYDRGGKYFSNTYDDHDGYFAFSATYRAPQNRYLNYDPHLGLPWNQPPGTPAFFISSVQDWKME